MNLTQEQKRIKLAEAAGWKCASHVAEFDKPFALMCWYRPGNAEWQTEEPPDYFNDLNAVHELEKLLTDAQWPEYREELRTIALGGIRLISQRCKADIHATADQRAEALGLTLSLWN